MTTPRTALVTGGASGIGAATARLLADQGIAVVIADIDSGAGEALAAEIGATFVHTDVASLADNIAVVTETVERFGSLDVAILGAGIGEPGGFPAEFDEHAYRRLVAVNQDGVVYGLHAALRHMMARGSGSIVVTAALAGLGANPLMPLYATTKHAVIGLVRSLGPAVAEHGITVNAFCPTFIDTPILQGAVPYLTEIGIAVLSPDAAAEAVVAILAEERTGHAWPLVPHQDLEPMPFPDLPTIMADPTAELPEPPT